MNDLTVRKSGLFRADIGLSGPVGFVNIRGVARYPLLGKFLKKCGCASELTVAQNGALKKYFINTKSFIKHVNTTQQQLNFLVAPLRIQDYKEINLIKIQSIFSRAAPEQNSPNLIHTQNSALTHQPNPDTPVKHLHPLKSSEEDKKNDERKPENDTRIEVDTASNDRAPLLIKPLTPPIEQHRPALKPIQITLPNGNVYKGDVDDEGRPHGCGEEANGLKLVYKGNYLNGLKEGEGEEYQLGKIAYKGAFKANLRSGMGKEFEVKRYDAQLILSTLIYEGEFVDGLREGAGQEFQTNKVIYDGSFKAGKRSGYGVEHEISSQWLSKSRTFLYLTSLSYKGDHLDGLREGQGQEYEYDKVTYDGSYKAGLRHGKGTLTDKYENIYIGEMADGKMEGKGVFTFANDIVFERHSFEGTFANDSFANGICRYKNGDVYEGAMTNGKKNGHGTLTKKNGDVYKGEFSLDKKSGQGVLTSADKKEIKDGVWLDDKLSKGTVRQEMTIKNQLITYVSEYAHEVKHGKETRIYSLHGKIISSYAHGKLHGKQLHYDIDGKLYLKQMYAKDQLLRKCDGQFNQFEILDGFGKLFDYENNKTYWGIFDKGKMTTSFGVFNTTDDIDVWEKIQIIQEQQYRNFFNNSSQSEPKTTGNDTLNEKTYEFRLNETVEFMKKTFDNFVNFLLEQQNAESSTPPSIDPKVFQVKNENDLKILYRKLAHYVHPDRNRNFQEQSNKSFQEIGKIYALFLETESRNKSPNPAT